MLALKLCDFSRSGTNIAKEVYSFVIFKVDPDPLSLSAGSAHVQAVSNLNSAVLYNRPRYYNNLDKTHSCCGSHFFVSRNFTKEL